VPTVTQSARGWSWTPTNGGRAALPTVSGVLGDHGRRPRKDVGTILRSEPMSANAAGREGGSTSRFVVTAGGGTWMPTFYKNN